VYGFAPGLSNMKVTTSPVSSAFIVMMSSLPAHLSILDCERGGEGRDVLRGGRTSVSTHARRAVLRNGGRQYRHVNGGNKA